MHPDPTRLHVLMVLEASTYPAVKGGGAESQVRLLAKSLRARGHRVTVLVPLGPHGDQARITRVDGVPLLRMHYPRIRLLGGPLLWAKLALFLFARRQRYDVLHVHIAHHMGAVCAAVGRVIGTRVLIKVSGIWEIERGALARRGRPLAWLTLIGLRQADLWQAISQRIAGILVDRDIPPTHIVSIPNAVDVARFADVMPASGNGARFVFVGRLAPEKGLPSLVDAFADIAARHPHAHLTLVGDGELRDVLTQQVAARGVGGQVTFAGFRSDVKALLAEANVGVLPSLFEGLSNTLLETMASGLPMIASRVSGNEDFVVHGENGWLFDADDRAALAQCLDDAASLPALERALMGQRARTAVERGAGLDHVLDQLVAAYHGSPATEPGALVPRCGH